MADPADDLDIDADDDGNPVRVESYSRVRIDPVFTEGPDGELIPMPDQQPTEDGR